MLSGWRRTWGPRRLRLAVTYPVLGGNLVSGTLIVDTGERNSGVRLVDDRGLHSANAIANITGEQQHGNIGAYTGQQARVVLVVPERGVLAAARIARKTDPSFGRDMAFHVGN